MFLNFKFPDIAHILWNVWMSVTVSISELILMCSVPQQVYIVYFGFFTFFTCLTCRKIPAEKLCVRYKFENICIVSLENSVLMDLLV